MQITNKSWNSKLGNELNLPYFKSLISYIDQRYKSAIVYPKKELILNCLNHFDFEKTKVVIIGQDPYHGENQANGLAFSVQKNQTLPPSLKNIFKEIESDLGIINSSGDLSPWSKQGVLLLNTTLTVEKGIPLSHANKGWETFTDHIIKTISNDLNGVIFLLWGNKAILKKKLIDGKDHLILSAPHPSPLSVYRGFYGCKHFSKVNLLLEKVHKTPINWQT
jgi:uracil-DNA glycosylase